MFVIVNQGFVLLGPMRWNRYRFENTITEELDIPCSLPDRNDSNQPIKVNDDTVILPVKQADVDSYNTTIETLDGPYWEFTDQFAIMKMKVVPLDIELAKSKMFDRIANHRWVKENSGITVTISNGDSYTFPTAKEGRSVFHQAVTANLQMMNYKLNAGLIVTLNYADITTIFSSITQHVQSAFDWETAKRAEINSKTTLEELAQVQDIDPPVPEIQLLDPNLIPDPNIMP